VLEAAGLPRSLLVPPVEEQRVQVLRRRHWSTVEAVTRQVCWCRGSRVVSRGGGGGGGGQCWKCKLHHGPLVSTHRDCDK
jgi:hypothetical protein